MGVFSYLNIKKPASMIWKALSPGRELSEVTGDNNSDTTEENTEIKRGMCSPNVVVDRHLINIGKIVL